MTSILAIHRYYWPDAPPYASLLRSIVRTWTAAGHRVDILATHPSYKVEASVADCPDTERVDGATVRRLRLRPDRTSRARQMLNMLWFPLYIGWKVLCGPRYDIIMCSTVPPVLLGWTVSLAARLRRAQFVYHCMDLHPEIGRLSGEFSHPAVYRLLARLELATCRRAAAVVVLSDDMLEAVVRRDPTLALRTRVITNFELPDFDSPQERATAAAPADPGRVRIAFTGNLGRFQGLETIVAAALSPRSDLDQVELVLMGEGTAKHDLECLVAQAPSAVRGRVRFLPHGSPQAARALLATSDLGLVSLAPGVIRFAYPSKMATYLGVGLPVLAAVEQDSAMVRLLEDSDAGLHLPTGEVEATSSRLADIVAGAGALPQLAVNARRLWEHSFSAQVLLNDWGRIIDDLTASPSLVRGV